MNEVGEACTQLAVSAVEKAIDGCVLDRSVHPLDLAVYWENSPPDWFFILQMPRMVWRRQLLSAAA